MVARVVSLQGSGAAQAGIMIRETLNADANHVYLFDYSSANWMTERTSTGASSSYQSLGSVTLPNWIKLARSGNVFSMYGSPDGLNWVQLGSSQTVSTAPNVYVGLAVSSRSTSSLATATFDNVSVSTPVAPPPNFSLSTLPSSVTIVQGASGTSTITVSPQNGFNGNVSLSVSGLPSGVTASFNPSSTTSTSTLTLTANSTATTGTVTVTITGTSGSLTSTTTVSLTVHAVNVPTLPSVWTDGDIGSTGVAGSAGYANDVFTVSGSGAQIYGTADAFHFVYQPLTGDGTMVARLVSVQGGSGYVSPGVMIRETLNAGATNAGTVDWVGYGTIYTEVRTSTGGSTVLGGGVSATLPYWVQVSRR